MMNKWQAWVLNVVGVLLAGLIITDLLLKKHVERLTEQVARAQAQVQPIINVTVQREAVLHKIAMRLAQSTDPDVRNLLSKHELSVKLNTTDKPEGKTESKTKN